MSSLAEAATEPMITQQTIELESQEQPMSYLQHALNPASVSVTTEEPKALFSSEIIPVTLFCGMSLVILLVAVICNEQGVWL